MFSIISNQNSFITLYDTIRLISTPKKHSLEHIVEKGEHAA